MCTGWVAGELCGLGGAHSSVYFAEMSSEGGEIGEGETLTFHPGNWKPKMSSLGIRTILNCCCINRGTIT